MATSIDKVFWAFVMYVKNNPFKSIDNMTENDFDAMVKQFAAVNESATITVATAPDYPDHYGYGAVDLSTDLYFPKRGTTTRWATDTNGVATSTTYALNMVALKSASYPEDPDTD